jgi:GTP pyrophosphokinase
MPAPLTPRFIQALTYAAELHQAQRRKGSGVPYIAHLLGVTSIVLEDGGDEDEAIAALLHDAVEDHPRGGLTEAEIGERFGPRVRDIVLACTDSDPAREDVGPKGRWEDRKAKYLEHLRQETRPEVLRVATADKLYNARSILDDHRLVGEAVWRRFSVPKNLSLWYYREVVKALGAAPASPQPHARLLRELEGVVEALQRRSGGSSMMNG